MRTRLSMFFAIISIFILLIVPTEALSQSNDEVLKAKASELAQKLLIVDTHIDVPYRLEEQYEDVTKATQSGDFDFPRAVKGGLNAPFMSIYIPARLQTEGGAKALAIKLISDVKNIVKSAPKKFAMAYSVDDILQQYKNQQISMLMGMENGAPIEGKIENLDLFYKKGIRYITLTHSKSNHICDSSYDPERPWKGLSPFGKELIVEMNRVGMMIDISHVSDEAFYQAISLSEAPLIASHSSARKFTPGFERNMDDDMLKALANNRGVIQINFGSSFLTKKARDWSDTYNKRRSEFNDSSPNAAAQKSFSENYRKQQPYPFADLNDVLDHIDHVVQLIGVDHVGIGSDYDGVGLSLPTGLKDVSTYPNLIYGLLKRNYTESDIEKILSGNLIRVWKEVNEISNRISQITKNRTN